MSTPTTRDLEAFLNRKPPPVAQSYYCDCGTKVKPKRCSCGKVPKVKATPGLFPQHVQCTCGEQSYECREYPAGAIKCWNKSAHYKKET